MSIWGAAGRWIARLPLQKARKVKAEALGLTSGWR